jgi:hypothetical protein
VMPGAAMNHPRFAGSLQIVVNVCDRNCNLLRIGAV